MATLYKVIASTYVPPVPAIDPTNIGTYIEIKYDPTQAKMEDRVEIQYNGSGGYTKLSVNFMDYLLVAFNYIITEELKNNSAFHNSYFQHFLQYVSEYRRILEESRSNALAEAAPIFDPTGIPIVYSCDSNHNYFTNNVGPALSAAIAANSININTFYPPGFHYAADVTLETHYFHQCSTDGIYILAEQVVIPALNMLENYRKSITNQQKTLSSDIHKNINEVMSTVNNAITNGDYASKYDTIQNIFKSTGDYIKDYANATSTEFNIIINTVDVSANYDNITFKESDIDPALIIPKDTNDLVDVDTYSKNIAPGTNLFKGLSGSNSWTSLFGATNSGQTSSQFNVSSMIKQLTNSIGKSINIPSPDPQQLDMAMTRIYRKDGVPVAKYLNAKDLAIEQGIELANQVKFLNTIADPAESSSKAIPTIVDTKEARYRQGYKEITMVQYGGDNNPSINKSYGKNINNKLPGNTQSYRTSQSGGADFDYPDIESRIYESNKKIDELVANFGIVKKISSDQKSNFFNNNDFLDIDSIEKINAYLISMMNIFILHNFLLGQDTTAGKKYFNDMENKLSEYQGRMTDVWDIMTSRLPKIGSSETIENILANGTVTSDQIIDLLATIGITKSTSTIDPYINNVPSIQLLESLVSKYGLDNISIISNSLSKIVNTKTANMAKKSSSLEEIYKEMNTFYSEIKSVNDKMYIEYKKVVDNAYDIDKLKIFVGEVIETNIRSINTYIKEMIINIQNYGIQTDIFDTIKKELNKNKKILNDMLIYTKDIKNKTNEYSGYVTPKIANFYKLDSNGGKVTSKDNIGDDYINTIYSHLIVEYVDKIKKSEESITKYYDLLKRNKNIDDNLIDVNFSFMFFQILGEKENGSMDSKIKNNNIDPLVIVIDEIRNNIDSGPNFIRDIVNKIINYMINVRGNCYEYMFEFIRNKLSTGYYLNYFINNFYIVKNKFFSDVLNKIYIFDNAGVNTKLSSKIPFTKEQLYSMIEYHVGIYLKQLNIYEEYFNGKSFHNTDNNTTARSNIIALLNTFLSDKSYQNLKTVVDYMKNTNNGPDENPQKEYRDTINDFLSKSFENQSKNKFDFMQEIISEFTSYSLDLSTFYDEMIKNCATNFFDIVQLDTRNTRYSENTRALRTIISSDPIFSIYTDYKLISIERKFMNADTNGALPPPPPYLIINEVYNNFLDTKYDVPIDFYNSINGDVVPHNYLLESLNKNNFKYVDIVRSDFESFKKVVTYSIDSIRMILSNKTIVCTKSIDINISILESNTNKYTCDTLFTDYWGYTNLGTDSTIKAPKFNIANKPIFYTEGGVMKIKYPNNTTSNFTGANMYNTNTYEPTTIVDENIIINIPVGNEITSNNISEINKIVSTFNFLLDLKNNLQNMIIDISDTNISSIAEFNAIFNLAAPAGSDELMSRKTKISILKNIILKLLPYAKIIADNSDFYYGISNMKILNNVGGNISNITYTNIDLMKVSLDGLDPLLGSFYKSYYVIWITIRAIIFNWNVITGFMLSKLVLSNIGKKIKDLVENFYPANKLNDYAKYIRENQINIRKGAKDTTKKQRNEIDTKIKLYNPSITTVTNPNYVDPMIIDKIKFDIYYTNLKNISSKIYIIQAFLSSNNPDIADEIISGIDDMNDYVGSIYIITNGMHQINNSTDLHDVIDKHYHNVLNVKDLKQTIRSFVDDLAAEIDKIFVSFSPGPNMYNNVATHAFHFKPYAEIGYLNYENNVTPMSNVPPNIADIFMIDHNGGKITNFNDAINTNLTVDQYSSYYKYLVNQLQVNKTDTQTYDILRMVGTEVIRIVWERLKFLMESIYGKIFINMNIVKCSLFSTNVNNILTDYVSAKIPFYTIPPPTIDANNSNCGSIKYYMFKGSTVDNVSEKTIVETSQFFNRMFSVVKKKLYDSFIEINNNYEKITNITVNITNTLREARYDIVNQNAKLDNVIKKISIVMFNKYYKKYAFVENNKLLHLAEETISNYQNIQKLILNKISDVEDKNNYYSLSLAQVNNYIAFKAMLGKKIMGQYIVEQLYNKLSFGVIEFYYDILNSIVTCLSNKEPTEMNSVEQYLYKFQYIQIMRCYKLFSWIHNDYQPMKEEQDKQKYLAKIKYIPLLQHKIEFSKTKGEIRSILEEFNGIRRYLDEYASTVMDRVQLHMRVNDFKNDKYNSDIDAFEVSNSVPHGTYDFMKDVDTKSPEYRVGWDNDKFLFTGEGNKLKINFDLVNKIEKTINPGSTKDFDIIYNSTKKEIDKYGGIEFSRIYDTIRYPDSDVISNYMSIAPNVKQGKGTVIMTYGYSGVGKSASLFGQPARASNGFIPSNGILQATLDNFSNLEIFFRVYEIYGLGVQYNFYWNPENAGQSECYPNIYQAVIHHVIDTNKDPNKIIVDDHIVFTNQHDILNYIMDLRNPEHGTGFYVNDDSNINLGGKTQNFSKFFNASNLFIGSSYRKINEKQYHNFDPFVKSIDEYRQNGILVKKILTHLISQVKGTINNPESSRSILVYDFQIKTGGLFVPFLIYDLPGKEDVYKTYVSQNNLTNRGFKDISGDLNNAFKSSYITNQLLVPIFKNNSREMINILKDLSSVSATGYTSGHGITGSGATQKFDAAFETNLVQSVLNMNITNFNYKGPNGSIIPTNYPISSLYNPANIPIITNFVQLFNPANIKVTNPDISASAFNKVIDEGITGLHPDLMNLNIKSITDEANIMFKVICIVVMGILIKNSLYDVVIEIICTVVDNTGNGSPDNGGWSRNKIYAFFEAYYINENVIGLLSYLINNVMGLNDPSIIPEQLDIVENINDTISRNYKVGNLYDAINSLLKYSPGRPLTINSADDYDYGFYVDKSLLTNADNDPLRKKEIDDYIASVGGIVSAANNKFALGSDTVTTVYNRIMNTINFTNKGNYDSNKIFRNGTIPCGTPVGQETVLNPMHAIDITAPNLVTISNRPLLQDLIEPYEQKISFYYVFYVVSNSQSKNKAEEQLKLINNSMPFIRQMKPSTKLNRC